MTTRTNAEISRAAGRAFLHAQGTPAAPTPIDPEWATRVQRAVTAARTWSDLPKRVRAWIQYHDPES